MTLIEQYLGWCTKRALTRARPLVIAVAGSVGKTSTKTAIGVALGAYEADSPVVASKKNYNNELGVPLTVFECDAPGRSPFKWLRLLWRAKYFALFGKLPAAIYVLEMGTDHPGDLDYLLSIAPPHISVLTAIGPEHTEFFGSVEGVAQEEASVLRALPSKGVAITNADDLEIQKITLPAETKRLTFGADDMATARILMTSVALDDEPSRCGLDVAVAMFGTTYHFRLHRSVGRPQAYAAAAALAVVAALDGDEREAAQRLEEAFDGAPGRMRLIEGIKHTWLIDDAYNSSPLAALSALRDLKNFPVTLAGRRIAALGDMLELGNLAERAHTDIGRAVAENGIDMLVACGTLAHAVADAATEAGLSDDCVFTFATSAEAGRFIQDRMKENDVVLIKGSQGARMERITRELMAHPDQAEPLLVRQSKEWLEKK